ncbi:MAG TPA: GNAT family N-acetyltransferase [Candidatus Rubrimentiphilum sp.]|nr:GNAT family N-acetyltransferase [Candidatus Rubrimentiphilum sp.]
METIETQRLLVRKWNVERDLEDAFSFYGDAETMRFIPGGVKDREQTRVSLQRMFDRDKEDGFGIWPVVHKADGRVIGVCGVFYIPDHAPDVEIAWLFDKAYHGQGYATEAARAVTKFAFADLRLPVLYALIHQDNAPSIRLADRLGMSFARMMYAYDRDLRLYERQAPQ